MASPPSAQKSEKEETGAGDGSREVRKMVRFFRGLALSLRVVAPMMCCTDCKWQNLVAIPQVYMQSHQQRAGGSNFFANVFFSRFASGSHMWVHYHDRMSY